jgi:hypothetical protein
MPSSVEVVRQHWEEGNRRLAEQAANPDRYDRLLAQVEAVTEELRRRIGETFTLEELARVYETADRWALEAVAERSDPPEWPRELAVAQDAAFHRYARGATDYAP